MSKKYIVTLADEERQILEQLTKKGKSPIYKVNHARILLLADTRREDGGWTDQAISKALDISIPTIERVRRQLVEQGIEAVLSRQTTKTTKSHKLDGEQEAHLIAIACSQAPVGFARWTLRLLAKRMVELEIVESISHETVRQTLKKTNLNLGSRNHGLFRPKLQPNLSTIWKM
jgi:transposase